MQARSVPTEDALKVFQDCKARIRSMSLVHEMLYGASDLSKIDYREYATKLTSDLTASYNHGNIPLTTKIEIETVELNINKAVPLGLLTNEVLTNSLKHAFQDVPHPEIFIKQIPSDKLKIVIGDNGKGLPSEVNFENPNSFGLKIIRLLAEQLNADLSVESRNGTVYTLEIPL
jgi:two-component sensor histidine kinase